MNFTRTKRLALICAMSFILASAASPLARAEVLTLRCGGENGTIYNIDLSANTASLTFITQQGAQTQNLSNVRISDSTISFVFDAPPAYRESFQIDRTSGTLTTQFYYYPQGHVTGGRGGSSQCVKIPNKAF